MPRDTEIKMDEEDKKLLEEFSNCLNTERRNYAAIPIFTGLACALFYGKSDNTLDRLFRKSVAAFTGFTFATFVTAAISFKSCSVQFNNFVSSMEKKKKAKSGEINFVPDDSSFSTGYGGSFNVSEDVFNIDQNDFQEKRDVTPPRKTLTYDDDGPYRPYDAVQSRKLEDKVNWRSKPAETPPAKPRATNIYGDPLE